MLSLLDIYVKDLLLFSYMQSEFKLKNNLKKLRKYAQPALTQAELADKVGVTRQTIIAIEKGDYQPSTKLALTIASILDVEFKDLFYLSKKTNA
jgi:putative transcriptional regulator